jgi:CBS domain-containing protein
MKLRDLMVKQVTSCTPRTNLEIAGQMMWDHDCGAIPVLDEEDHPVGIVTDRDIAMSAVLNHKPLWDITAGEVTGSRDLHTCRVDDDLQKALDIMQAHKVRRMPVVDDDGRLQGMLSIDDVIARAGLAKGKARPPVSYEETMTTLKAVCSYH